MIRLQPTAILLGESDVRDFLQRESQRRVEAQLEQLERLTVNSPDGDSKIFQPQNWRQLDSIFDRKDDRPVRQPSISRNLNSPPRKQSVTTIPEQTERRISESQLRITDQNSPNDLAVDGHSQRSNRKISQANDSQMLAGESPEKEDDFHYGGFTESPSQNDKSTVSSSFAPDDHSTPQHLPALESRSTRARAPLPRSPLYYSQNISKSPEPRPITGLTPRVVSRVAMHNSPGIIFSVPPRRPPRLSPRFRHQTNSFSFDESERSSAAYEQQRGSSGFTDEGTPRPEDTGSLHEELRHSSMRNLMTPLAGEDDLNLPEELEDNSLHNVSATIVETTLAPDFQEDCSSPVASQAINRRDRECIFSSSRSVESEDEEGRLDTRSSPNLPLPPPFSSARRNASNSEALPGSYGRSNLGASPLTMPSSSPTSRMEQQWSATRRPNQFDRMESPQKVSAQKSSSSSRISSTGQLIARIVSTYRAVSPLTRSPRSGTHSPVQRSSSLSASSTPRLRMSSRETQGTPRDYRVYNDQISPATQPQTPAHLPESRHRSRFHPSWTEPTDRAGRGRHGGPAANHDGAGSERSDQRVDIFATPSRRQAPRRADSPVGMTGEGFQGLYGGRENGDDEQSWLDGVRFDNAEIRLWSVGDTRTEGRSLNNTPEREDWRSNLR